jgi:hypothetical protein
MRVVRTHPAAVHKSFTSPGVADTYTFLMNSWNTLPESYQQRVYNNTLATVNRQIQQVENPTPAVVISVEAVHVDNAILLDYLTFEAALEKPEIRSSDPNIPIDNNCTDDKLHFRMWGGNRDYKDDGDGSDVGDVIPTASQWWRPATDLERFNLGTIDVNEYEGGDGDDADPHEEEEASKGDDGSTQKVEDWGRSR